MDDREAALNNMKGYAISLGDLIERRAGALDHDMQIDVSVRGQGSREIDQPT
jgi:hypothetical protein